VIENYAPGVLDKLGLGARTLTEEKADLIYLSMGAFGPKGPWRSFRAYGSTVEQASGLPFVNGEADDPPTMQHVAYGDPIAGIYGAIACLIALYQRNARGLGAVIDLGQVECLFQLCADAIVAQSVQVEPLHRSGSRHPLSALRTVVAAANPNGWIALSVETAKQWNALAHAIGRADLRVDETAGLDAMKAREIDMERAVTRGWLRRPQPMPLQPCRLRVCRPGLPMQVLTCSTIHSAFRAASGDAPSGDSSGTMWCRTPPTCWTASGCRCETRHRRWASTMKPC
jgi:crotonobetainyl-CoA:carnitine CoA-transferase CaiB-like acyl-CoA transferase